VVVVFVLVWFEFGHSPQRRTLSTEEDTFHRGGHSPQSSSSSSSSSSSCSSIDLNPTNAILVLLLVLSWDSLQPRWLILGPPLGHVLCNRGDIDLPGKTKNKSIWLSFEVVLERLKFILGLFLSSLLGYD